MKARILRWLGHLKRLDNNRIVKIIAWKKNKAGPWKTWKKVVGQDLLSAKVTAIGLQIWVQIKKQNNMGTIFSKSSKKVKHGADQTKDVQNTAEQSYQIFDPNKYDEQRVQQLQWQLENDTETFILNQMLMCVMFFYDFAEEIGICTNTIPEINQKLIEEHRKELILPDSIIQNVCQKIKFQPVEGAIKNLKLPIANQRMYVVHNNIEVEYKTASGHPANYIDIDKPSYRVEVEESKEHKGYVRVKMMRMEEKRSSYDSVCSTSSEKCYEMNATHVEESVPSSSFGFKNDSGFNTESDYDYTNIIMAKTPQKLQKLDPNFYTHIYQLPSKCITTVRSKNIHLFDSDSDDDEDDEKNSDSETQVPSLFIVKHYLNSTQFMAHFRDNVFPNYLGNVLEFPNVLIEQLTSIPGSIFCDNVDDFNNFVNYEIFPAIAMPWPDEMAFEWGIRRRVTVFDKKNDTTIAYKWPTEKMIDEAKQLNCVLVPKGFIPKKGSNPFMEIEWELCFPKAERYLELRMTQAQIRIYLLMLIWHKTYVEPKTKKCGLLIEHIRHLMFWECEANYKAWPEDKLGTKLIEVFKSLSNHLSKAQLPNYFIRGKNLLENTPSKSIMPTLELANIFLESPVFTVLDALRNIKCTASKFYPEMDLDKLHYIMSGEVFNDVRGPIHLVLDPTTTRRNRNDENTKRDKELEWNKRRLRAQRQRKLLDNKEETKKELKVSIDKLFKSSVLRVHLLNFFVQHFIKIAKRSTKIGSTHQSLFYLKQAWYLTRLLEETDIENCRLFQNQIREHEEVCQRKKVTEATVPITPKRNTFNAGDVLQVKGKNINIANLSKSYNDSISARHTETEENKVANSRLQNVTADVHPQAKDHNRKDVVIQADLLSSKLSEKIENVVLKIPTDDIKESTNL
ncbi:hypothetical protein FQA39_LY00953 [Lamprigera yunnana]|nr:hypothetical protein FQA39_LY00953 [Lamprigera yunnana]